MGGGRRAGLLVLRFIGLVITIGLLIVCVDGFLRAAAPSVIGWYGARFGQSEAPSDTWSKLAENDRPSFTRKVLTVRIQGERLSGGYEIRMPRGNDLFRAVERGAAESDPDRFVREFLGLVRLGQVGVGGASTTELSFSAPRASGVGATGEASIEVPVRELTLRGTNVNVTLTEPRLLRPPHVSDNRLVIEAPGARVNLGDRADSLPVATPLIQSHGDSRTEISLIGPEPEWSYGFPLITISVTGVQLRYRAREATLGLSLLRLTQARLPYLGSMLLAIPSALPLLAFLWFANRKELATIGTVQAFKPVAVALLGFHLFLPLSSLLFQQRVSGWIAEASRLLDSSSRSSDYRYIAVYAPVIVLGAVVWPVAIGRRLAPTSKPTHGRAYWMILPLWIGFAGSILVAGLLTAPLLSPRWSGWLVPFNSVAAWAACTYLVGVVLVWQLLGGRRLPLVAAAAGLALLLGSLAFVPVYGIPSPRTQGLTFVVILVLGVPMVAGFWRIFAYALQHNQLANPDARVHRWVRRAGPVLVLLLAIPNLSFWQDPFNYQAAIGSWTLIALAYALDGFTVLALLTYLYLVLTRSADRQGSRLDVLAMRQLGILFAILLFFSTGGNWLSAVTVFFVGWLLADLLLLPLSQARLLPAITRMESDHARRLRRLIRLRRLERALTALEREYLPKVGKGEISFEDFEKRQRPLQTRIGQLRPAKSKGGIDAQARSQDLVLAARPVRSDWDNAIRCARLGLLFAAPWLVLYAWQVLTGPSLGASFATLRLVQGLCFVIARWLAYGFFFGFFYRYIRGLNGLQKGTWLFVTVVTPSLLANALLYQHGADWPTTVQWALQIFVVSMLLGLVAGDYESFRSAKLGWRQLVEVHNGRALITWGSSVIIAIGASISTFIVTGFTQVLNAYLVSAGYLGPGGTRPGR